jgi:hypothetical protein
MNQIADQRVKILGHRPRVAVVHAIVVGKRHADGKVR